MNDTQLLRQALNALEGTLGLEFQGVKLQPSDVTLTIIDSLRKRLAAADGVKAVPATGGGWEPDAWAGYIAGVLVTYLSSPNAARESDRREDAIAGIIRRRIHWLMPATSGVGGLDGGKQ